MLHATLVHRLFLNSRFCTPQTDEALGRFGDAALVKTYEHGIRISVLAHDETYRDHSTVLRTLGIDVDAWSPPPAGLFIVQERMMFIKRLTPMTVVHEFGHAIDCTLGGGIYRSALDRTLQLAFANARRWITPYAATRIDEYFAEGLRAYVEVNDPISPWPYATRERLASYDPALFTYIDKLFTHDFALPPPFVT